MKIVLPWPDKRMSPNARVHWAVLANVKAKARRDAEYATYAALEGGLREARLGLAGEGAIAFKVTFYPPDKRQRDDDNLVSMVKASRDGIADALGVNDRRFKSEYYFEEPCKPGRVEVHLSPAWGQNVDNFSSPESTDSATEKRLDRRCANTPARDPNAYQERIG